MPDLLVFVRAQPPRSQHENMVMVVVHLLSLNVIWRPCRWHGSQLVEVLGLLMQFVIVAIGGDTDIDAPPPTLAGRRWSCRRSRLMRYPFRRRLGTPFRSCLSSFAAAGGAGVGWTSSSSSCVTGESDGVGCSSRGWWSWVLVPDALPRRSWPVEGPRLAHLFHVVVRRPVEVLMLDALPRRHSPGSASSSFEASARIQRGRSSSIVSTSSRGAYQYIVGVISRRIC